jgi:hypothetical protein
MAAWALTGYRNLKRREHGVTLLSWQAGGAVVMDKATSGTTHIFRAHRRKQVTLGVIGVAIGIASLAVGIDAAINPAAADQTSRSGPIVAAVVGPCFIWLGICAFRMGVQVRGGKLIISNEWWTRTVRAGDIRAVTLEPKAVNEAGATHWVARVQLTDGKNIWIDGLDCGTTRRPPRPELAATVDEVRALLGSEAFLLTGVINQPVPARKPWHRRTP